MAEMKSVYSAVRTGSLSKTACASSLKGKLRYYIWSCIMIIFTVNSSHRRKEYELFIRVTENVNIEMNILKTGK